MRWIRSILALLAAITIAASPSYAQTTYPPSLVQTVNNIAPDATGNIAIPTTQFVSGFTAGAGGTLANLLATAPCQASRMGLYADVVDLYNNGVAGAGIDDIVRCRYDATNLIYRWTPQREAYNGAIASTSGTVTVTPLVTPPTLRLTSNPLGTLNITPIATNAYIGQRVRIIMQGTVGAFLVQVTGLIGSNITLLSGGTTVIEYGPTGWFQAGS